MVVSKDRCVKTPRNVNHTTKFIPGCQNGGGGGTEQMKTDQVNYNQPFRVHFMSNAMSTFVGAFVGD